MDPETLLRETEELERSAAERVDQLVAGFLERAR
jgi:hypothetical protein